MTTGSFAGSYSVLFPSSSWTLWG